MQHKHEEKFASTQVLTQNLYYYIYHLWFQSIQHTYYDKWNLHQPVPPTFANSAANLTSNVKCSSYY